VQLWVSYRDDDGVTVAAVETTTDLTPEVAEDYLRRAARTIGLELVDATPDGNR
jgi:hypothetical protein